MLVAFSGGADSAFLAWMAHDTLGPDRAFAVTAVSPVAGPRRGRRLRRPGRRVGPALAGGDHRRARPARVRGQRHRPLRPLQGRADGRHRPHRHRRVGHRRARHEPRRPGRPPARPGRRRVAAARRSRWSTPGSPRRRCGRRPGRWACAPGTSRRPPAWPPASRTARRSRWARSTAWPGPKPPCARSGSASSGSATTATWPAWRSSSRTWPGVVERRQAVVDAVKAAGYARVTLDLEGFRSGT